MKNIILFTWDNQLKKSIERYFKYVYNLDNVDLLDSIFKYPSDNTNLIEIFYIICDRIEKKLFADGNPKDLRETIFLVDSCYFYKNFFIFEEDLDAVETNNFYLSLVSMLVLAFPEISFIDILRFFKDDIKIERILPELFDPQGLRDTCKKNMQKDGNFITYSTRDNLCFAIDDEKSYAYLEGYLGYLCGYRGVVITRFCQFEIFKNCNKEKFSYVKKPDVKKTDNDKLKFLVFEDRYLNFVDRPAHEHLSGLETRHKLYPWIYKNSEKFMVSVMHNIGKNIDNGENSSYVIKNNCNKEKIEQNDEKTEGNDENYIKKSYEKIIYKPMGGIYNFLMETDKLKDRTKILNEKEEKTKQLIEGGGNSPPEKTSHSAPGRLLAVSEILIERSKKIYNTAIFPEDCIHGAILALEAIELLDYKTPTTAFEAIAIKHKLEVKAECMFYGVTHNIKVKERYKDLEKEIEIVSKWFNEKKIKKIKVNALLSISNELTRIFMDYGQFDEEMKSRSYFRSFKREWDFLTLYENAFKKLPENILFNKIKKFIDDESKNHFFIKKITGLPFFIFKLIRKYIESLLDSIKNFLIAIIAWPIGATVIILMWNKFFNSELSKINLQNFYIAPNNFFNVYLNSIISFFNLNHNFWQNYIKNGPFNFPTSVFFIGMSLSGLLHFGIFISHLYSIISRK